MVFPQSVCHYWLTEPVPPRLLSGALERRDGSGLLQAKGNLLLVLSAGDRSTADFM